MGAALLDLTAAHDPAPASSEARPRWKPPVRRSRPVSAKGGRLARPLGCREPGEAAGRRLQGGLKIAETVTRGSALEFAVRLAGNPALHFAGGYDNSLPLSSACGTG